VMVANKGKSLSASHAFFCEVLPPFQGSPFSPRIRVTLGKRSWASFFFICGRTFLRSSGFFWCIVYFARRISHQVFFSRGSLDVEEGMLSRWPLPGRGDGRGSFLFGPFQRWWLSCAFLLADVPGRLDGKKPVSLTEVDQVFRLRKFFLDISPILTVATPRGSYRRSSGKSMTCTEDRRVSRLRGFLPDRGSSLLLPLLRLLLVRIGYFSNLWRKLRTCLFLGALISVCVFSVFLAP